jgi:hypothetical protein
VSTSCTWRCAQFISLCVLPFFSSKCRACIRTCCNRCRLLVIWMPCIVVVIRDNLALLFLLFLFLIQWDDHKASFWWSSWLCVVVEESIRWRVILLRSWSKMWMIWMLF